jgi:hypothetical protein
VEKMSKISVLVDRKNIYYIKYIFEGYDGMAQVTTQDKNKAIVNLIFHNSQHDQFTNIIKAFFDEGIIREVFKQ